MLIAILAAVITPLLLWAAFRLWLTARRLDRLHKRTEAAWFACEESLGRRIVATRALITIGRLPQAVGAALREAAITADHARRSERDEPETQLTALLERLSMDQRGELHEELADAEERVRLAAQFYNDAVRDTRALRSSWFTRFFRLAGHAVLPEYFLRGAADD